MIHIYTIESALSDGSMVYDVKLRRDETEQYIRLACVSENDADAFSEGLRRLIEDHTTHIVRRAF